jgi:thymidylate synthase
MYLMGPYDNALQEILDKGIKKQDRTGVGCISVAGIQTKYRLDTGFFPIVTGRKVFPKSIFAELIWFLSGSTMNQDLEALGAKFWGKWCDENNTKYRALREKWGYPKGCFGPIYGHQLRYFGSDYIKYINTGKTPDDGFDQLAYMIDILKNDPFGSNGRRCLFSLWNPKDLDKMALPPCFSGTASVMTSNEYKFIKDVIVGDIVIDDKGDEKAVRDIHKTMYNGEIYSFGVRYLDKFECTPNHPFFVKDKGWVSAEDIAIGDFLKVETKNKNIIPVFSYDKVYCKAKKGSKKREYIKYTKKEEVILTEENMWTMGYFLGDGWIQDKRKRINFSILENDSYIINRIRKTIKIARLGDSSRSGKCIKYGTQGTKWFNILNTFGRYSHGKSIPKWVFDSPIEYRESFLDGYFCADGGVTKHNNCLCATTVSKSIAYGIQKLIFSIGKLCAVKLSKKDHLSWEIDGRTGKSKDLYNISMRGREASMNGRKRKNNDVITERDIVWLKVFSKVKKTFNDYVYNLDVADSHTYTVNNVSTHNCHYTYQAIPDGDGGLTGILTQRSNDVLIGNCANIQFYSALTIMLAQQCGMKAKEFIHNANDAHIYINQIEQVKEYLARPKPDSPILEIKKAKDIFSYKVEDFVLTNYNPEPKIDIPVSV